MTNFATLAIENVCLKSDNMTLSDLNFHLISFTMDDETNRNQFYQYMQQMKEYAGYGDDLERFSKTVIELVEVLEIIADGTDWDIQPYLEMKKQASDFLDKHYEEYQTQQSHANHREQVEGEIAKGARLTNHRIKL